MLVLLRHAPGKALLVQEALNGRSGECLRSLGKQAKDGMRRRHTHLH
jgi:hypothetical protein